MKFRIPYSKVETGRKLSYPKLDSVLKDNNYSEEQQQEKQVIFPKVTETNLIEHWPYCLVEINTTIFPY